MNKTALLIAVPVALFAASTSDHPSGNRTTPPTLNSVSPVGIARGTTVEMTVEGLNLAKSSAIYFSEPGVTGRILRVKELPDLSDVRLGSNGTLSTIDLGPLPPRNQVTVEIDVSPDAEIGPVRFRLQTPLGTSPEGRFLIEPYYGESPDKEPNDTPENAFECYLPTILAGTISKPGDVDYFKIKVDAGEELVFDNGAALIGSTLEPVVTILAEDQSVVKEFGGAGGMEAIRFAHKFDKAGTYYVRISDYAESGKASHFYRIKVGSFPLVAHAWPLGVQLGKTRDIALEGWNLPVKLSVKGDLTRDSEDSLRLRAAHSFNQFSLALGRDPEIDGASVNAAMPVPVTINGRLETKTGHSYRLHASKGQQLVFEVNARRLGSPLDSFVEILDAKGQPIERATARPVLETNITLAERDSSSRNIRLQSAVGLNVGDYVMIGGEILRFEAQPKGPDDDAFFEGFGGQRIAFFDTTTESHAIDKAVYKVQIYPPGAKFSSNGLPLVRLYYQNDDGGPGYSKDSLVHFTAPADGDYIVHLRDVRNMASHDFAYRLNVREPRPDFRLSVSPRNPSIPAGGCIPISVTAFRMDGFQDAIQIALDGLPPGVHANAGTIARGQVSTTILLSADATAKLDRAAPLNITGRFGALTHMADPDDKLKLVSLMPPPDLTMTSETREIVLEPGGTAEVTVDVQRHNGFAGRVPVNVRNLPPRVLVLDIGLNGVLINENETRRAFTIQALPSAEPIEQLIYVGGNIETRSGLQTVYTAAQPILLKIK
jgi:hypothetical protein